jgi:hypothetical protein
VSDHIRLVVRRGFAAPPALAMAAAVAVLPAVGRCQSTPDSAVQGSNLAIAKLVFVRKSRFMAVGERADIRVNDEIVARIDNGKTVTVDVAAGDVTIDIRTEWDFGKLTMPLKVEPGQTYRVEMDAQMPQSIAGLHGVPLFIRPPYSSNACGGRWCVVISKVDPAAAPAP